MTDFNDYELTDLDIEIDMLKINTSVEDQDADFDLQMKELCDKRLVYIYNKLNYYTNSLRHALNIFEK